MLFQKIIVYKIPPGGRGSIASSRPTQFQNARVDNFIDYEQYKGHLFNSGTNYCAILPNGCKKLLKVQTGEVVIHWPYYCV